MVDLCPICTYEHLLKSAGYLNEAKGTDTKSDRYKDKIEDAVKELFLAQEHDPEPDFAAKIRDFRIDRVEAPLFDGKIDTGLALEDMQGLISAARDRLPKEESVAEAHKKYHKGKGHSKDYSAAPIKVAKMPSGKKVAIVAAGEDEAAAELLKEKLEHPTLPEDVIRQIVENHVKAGGNPDCTEKIDRCVVEISEDQPSWCLAEKAWGESRDGVTCYNPYAVCKASVKCQ